MFSKLFLTLAAAVLAVNTQDITVANLPPCAAACLVSAGTTSNCNFPETPDCLCESAQFIADASACLKAHCSDDDITAAVYLQVAMCGGGQTVTGTVTTTHSVPFSLPSTSSGASASRSAPSAYVAGSTSTTPATYTSAPAATSSRAAASSFQALGGAGAAIGALLAGVLAL